MPRNFGIRHRDDDFWNGSSQDYGRDPVWPFVVIGLAVAAIIAVAIFVQ